MRFAEYFGVRKNLFKMDEATRAQALEKLQLLTAIMRILPTNMSQINLTIRELEHTQRNLRSQIQSAQDQAASITRRIGQLRRYNTRINERVSQVLSCWEHLTSPNPSVETRQDTPRPMSMPQNPIQLNLEPWEQFSQSSRNEECNIPNCLCNSLVLNSTSAIMQQLEQNVIDLAPREPQNLTIGTRSQAEREARRLRETTDSETIREEDERSARVR